MDRRYLVAALAIIATFTGLNHGFQTLQRIAFDRGDNSEAIAAARCWASSAAQSVAKLRAHFRHDYSPEQAQMVAEMNLRDMQMNIAERMAQQDASRCAHEKMMRQAERVRREALRKKQESTQALVLATPDASAFTISIPSVTQERILKELAKSQMQLQTAQEKLASIEIPTADVDTQVSTTVLPNLKCRVKVSPQALRDSMRGFQYGFVSR